MSVLDRLARVAAAYSQTQNQTQTQSQAAPTTVVLVHGFLGSSESFEAFASHLPRALSDRKNLTVKPVAFEFATKGSNEARVAELVAWLAQRGNVPQGNVALLGHSMGGLLITDAARAIQNSPEHAHLTVTHILAFDSPFLGVHPSVILHSGAHKIKSHIGGFLGAITSTPSSSESTKVTTTISASKSSSSSTSAWGVAAGFAAVAATAYAVSRTEVGKALLSSAQMAVSEHASFLGPLWSPGNQEERMKWVMEATRDRGVRFACFYLETTMRDKAKADALHQQVIVCTFITLPHSLAAYVGLFRKIPYNSLTNTASREVDDEIEAHMNMFRPAIIGQEVYQAVLDNVVDQF
ncbi:hypothetical protein BC830DRAFT_1112399 [Chytriomyces sp. MP71]|nr:hypothetical protein BC830DRAFT_1112399 [Chytriomyces sp. MP71]